MEVLPVDVADLVVVPAECGGDAEAEHALGRFDRGGWARVAQHAVEPRRARLQPLGVYRLRQPDGAVLAVEVALAGLALFPVETRGALAKEIRLEVNA